MFGKGSKSRIATIDTIVGAQTRLEGDVHFSGGLHVDGTIKGNIIADLGSEAVLTVSEQGSVEGEVRVPNLVLNGTVVGDVYASERVELASHARVTGNVYYKLIEMAMGAEVNGNLVHKAEQRTQSQGEPKVVSVDEPGMQTAK
jgi:cytoskeletal protein CcmA (bactofilin family)